MEKKIEDYLHLYFGCECEYMEEDDDKVQIVKLEGRIIDNEFYWCKPLLRPLSSITEEENILDEICVAIGVEPHLFYQAYADLILILVKGDYENTSLYVSVFEMAEIIRILCKHGIDVFNLIESGLAIDKNTII